MNFRSTACTRGWRLARAWLVCLATATSLLAPALGLAQQGKDPASICATLVDQRSIGWCNRAIDNTPVDPLAAAACSRLPGRLATLSCMRNISGSRYTREQIVACDELSDSWDTVLCFYTSGQRIAPRNPSGNGAEELCMRLTNNRLAERCAAVVQESYIQPSAAQACDRLPTNGTTLSCIEAIAGQHYSEAEVQSCDSLSSSNETIACFTRTAPPAEPTWSPPPPPPFQPVPRPGPPPREPGGCNSYGCYGPGGGCNSYGCYTAGGGCNSYGCWKFEGGCNSYGCWKFGGGCNSYGCWHSRQGSCNSYGCTPFGQCNSYGCPKTR